MKINKPATQAFTELAKKFKQAQLSRLGKSIAISIQKKISTKQRNSEIPNYPYSKQYASWKKKRYPSRYSMQLFASGNLAKSTDSATTKTKIEVGYNGKSAKVAKAHNEGIGRQNKRYFLFLGATEKKIIDTYILNSGENE